jgi:hypothetical protein
VLANLKVKLAKKNLSTLSVSLNDFDFLILLDLPRCLL